MRLQRCSEPQKLQPPAQSPEYPKPVSLAPLRSSYTLPWAYWKLEEAASDLSYHFSCKFAERGLNARDDRLSSQSRRAGHIPSDRSTVNNSRIRCKHSSSPG